jgi:hypothetical protein
MLNKLNEMQQFLEDLQNRVSVVLPAVEEPLE